MENPLDLCRRCAEEGKTCCQGRVIFVTLGDVARIRLAVPDKEFYQMQAVRMDDYKAFLPYDEVWGRVFQRQNGVRTLRRDASGDCCFLAKGGCGLSLESRPLVCRLYPYDYNNVTVKGVYGHLCPLPERENGALLLALLGMNRDRAEEWRAMLYREIADEFS